MAHNGQTYANKTGLGAWWNRSADPTNTTLPLTPIAINAFASEISRSSLPILKAPKLGFERLRQVFDQIVWVLEPGGNPQKVDGRRRSRCLDRRAVLDEAFHAAEAGRPRE